MDPPPAPPATPPPLVPNRLYVVSVDFKPNSASFAHILYCVILSVNVLLTFVCCEFLVRTTLF